MRRVGFVVAVVLTLALAGSCGGKKSEEEQPSEESAEPSEPGAKHPQCKVDEDCFQTEVCLGGQCISTARGGVYHNPRRAVTPAKVKGEVDRRLEEGQDRMDQRLEETAE